jgi:hypothetical protein
MKATKGKDMKIFMNNLYGAVGSEVSGFWHGKPFLGTIVDTRVKYGNDIQVNVEDGNDIYILDGSVLYAGGNDVYTNLHVYFKKEA